MRKTDFIRQFVGCLLIYGIGIDSDYSRANQHAQQQQSINDIVKEIKAVSRTLNANTALLKTETDRLANVERKIHQLNKQLLATERELVIRERLDRDLAEQVSELTAAQAKDRAALSLLVRERYMHGKPNYLKMLLNQQNPYAVGRLSSYYDYFSKAQLTRIDAIRSEIAKAEALLKNKHAARLRLENQRQLQVSQQQALTAAKQDRKRTVDRLNKKVSQNREKLKRLKEDEVRLNKLLQQIAVQAARLKKIRQEKAAAEQLNWQLEAPTLKGAGERPVFSEGFNKQSGKLQYPVSGDQKYHYGSRLLGSGMRAQGVFFETDGAQPIRSIYRGRVLFADYLKGYGLLLIVDHGDDHISLYGHNGTLYKEAGDLVQTNELVALSGVSGGLDSHGLYFEIRKSAKPVDPARWFR